MGKVLIIDDDQLFRSSLTVMFEKEGYQVMTACEGEEGVELFRKHGFCLVITDIIMPVMEGIETILRLRELNPELQIIAMSGGGKLMAEAYLNTARLLKVNAILKKPFSFKELQEVLAKLNT
ncbi:MAG: response regulator [Bacteroidales bacterium]|nr:response regulator [Deltaproteobacteria bacterium]MBL7138685.1 response regulator [Bacteroidales bacterium]